MAKQSPKSTIKNRILLCAMMLASIAVLPTTLILFIGMLPTIALRLGSRGNQKSRVLTVGFMNFAGVFPIWFKLMQGQHNFESAVHLVSDPFNIIMMYGAAVIGYLIEWTLAGFVAGMMVAKGRKRLEEIKKIQEELIVRWGKEVSGDIPLDIHGFPVEVKEK